MSEHFGFEVDGGDPTADSIGPCPDSWGADDGTAHGPTHEPLADAINDGNIDDGAGDSYGYDRGDDAGLGGHADPALADAGHGFSEDGSGPDQAGHDQLRDDQVGHDQVGPDHLSGGGIPEHSGGHEAAGFGLDWSGDGDPPPMGADASYPPTLDVAVSPADGLDWVDPRLLGSEDGVVDAGHHVDLAEPHDLLASLHAAAGGDGEPSWEAMHASDDPATRALAAFWDPLGR